MDKFSTGSQMTSHKIKDTVIFYNGHNLTPHFTIPLKLMIIFLVCLQ